MSEKIEQILTNFKDEAKKHKTFEKNFIVRLIKIIEKNKDSSRCWFSAKRII